MPLPCSQLTIETLKQGFISSSSVYIVNFEHVIAVMPTG